jgi:Fe-S-cluster containining protein
MGKSFNETHKVDIRKRALELTKMFENKSDLEIVQSLYKMADDRIKEMVLSNPLSCTKGCSFCCHGEVQISNIEASYFLNKIGESKGNEEILKKQNSVKDFKELKWVNTRCPMLGENEECTVYEDRPLICRMTNSIDNPQLCKENEPRRRLFMIEISAIQASLIILSDRKLISLHKLLINKNLENNI